MILLLDMNCEEAVACLHFFGYGLARFDREDVAFTYMLKNNLDWPPHFFYRTQRKRNENATSLPHC